MDRQSGRLAFRCVRWPPRLVLALVLAAAGWRPGWAADAVTPNSATATAPATTDIGVQVSDRAGQPVAGVLVVAADAASDRVATMAVTDSAGRVSLRLPRRRHNFGVLSASVGVEKMTAPRPDSVALVVRPLPAGAEPGAAGSEGAVATINSPRAWVIRGRVVDPLGEGLEGVRIEGLRAQGGVAAVTVSGPGGRFAIAVPGGQSRLRAAAPGLKSVSSSFQQGRVLLTMAIVADVEQVVVTSGPMLRFRPQDSIDPEYTPPAPVRAWLQYAYGICPAKGPLRAADKQVLKKYWYLDVLRREPPNPATISTSSCTSAAAFEQLPRNVTEGFDSPPD